MRKCPHPDCTEEIGAKQFACFTHWYGLPREIRDPLWRAWETLLNDPKNLNAAKALKPAQADAEAFWKAKKAEGLF